MHDYFVYGVHLRSELLLPELISEASEPDVTLVIGDLGGSPAEDGPVEVTEVNHQDEISISLRGVGKALIQNGNRIIVEPVPGLKEKNFRLFILGPVLAALLYQRGSFVLHASAVAINDGIVGFLGDKGAGKSTTAAALYKKGYPLVSDDLLVLDLDHAGSPMVQPGFPQLKLWPDSAESVGDNPDSLPRLHPEFTKRARQARDIFCSHPLPLKRLYILHIGEAAQITSVPKTITVLELIRHTYGRALIGSPLIDAAVHLQQCRQVLDHIPAVRLQRPFDLTRLDEVITIIEKTELEAE